MVSEDVRTLLHIIRNGYADGYRNMVCPHAVIGIYITNTPGHYQRHKEDGGMLNIYAQTSINQAYCDDVTTLFNMRGFTSEGSGCRTAWVHNRDGLVGC